MVGEFNARGLILENSEKLVSLVLSEILVS